MHTPWERQPQLGVIGGLPSVSNVHIQVSDLPSSVVHYALFGAVPLSLRDANIDIGAAHAARAVSVLDEDVGQRVVLQGVFAKYKWQWRFRRLEGFVLWTGIALWPQRLGGEGDAKRLPAVEDDAARERR